ncbi:MAG: hypothetical protein HC902_08830 [Calothrix sp. SM1_5_4]|nr:hypothetical protein [Calothrix sp. SM1_5_4]
MGQSAYAMAVEASRMKLSLSRDPTVSSFQIQSNQYISRGQNYFRREASGSNEAAILTFRSDRRPDGGFGYGVSLRNEFSATEEWNYFNLHEAYLSRRVGDESLLSLGRKQDVWTEWEGTWAQGFFQPRYVQNRLRPENAGLVGAFLRTGEGSYSFTLGVLPVHVPDFGPHFSTEDYRFVSANPWFRPPASEFELGERGTRGRIRYSVDEPPVEQVLAHAGAVVKVEWKSGPYRGRLSGAYKPMPQFLLGFPGRMWVLDEIDYMEVDITPRVGYHRLVNLDNAVQVGAWTFSASIAHENPEDRVSAEGWTLQRTTEAWVVSASASRPLEEEGPGAARIQFGMIKVQGGDAPDEGYFASSTSSKFDRRYQFSEAYMVAWSQPFRRAWPRPWKRRRE